MLVVILVVGLLPFPLNSVLAQNAAVSTAVPLSLTPIGQISGSTLAALRSWAWARACLRWM
jgi:hypothetical protein